MPHMSILQRYRLPPVPVDVRVHLGHGAPPLGRRLDGPVLGQRHKEGLDVRRQVAGGAQVLVNLQHCRG